MTASRSSIGVGHNSIDAADSPDRLLAPRLRLGSVYLTKDTRMFEDKEQHPHSGARLLLTLTIVTIVGGAVLGLRYKVFILLAVATFVLVFVIGVGVAQGAGIWRIALDMMVATTALQLGYAGGSAFAAARKRRKLRSGENIAQEDVNSGP